MKHSWRLTFEKRPCLFHHQQHNRENWIFGYPWFCTDWFANMQTRCMQTRHEKGSINPLTCSRFLTGIDFFRLFLIIDMVFYLDLQSLSFVRLIISFVIFFDSSPPSPFSSCYWANLSPCLPTKLSEFEFLVSLHRPLNQTQKARKGLEFNRLGFDFDVYASVLSKILFGLQHLVNFGYSCLLQSIMLWCFLWLNSLHGALESFFAVTHKKK